MQPSPTSCHFSPNILLSILSLCSSLNVTDQVMVLHILISMFLESRRDMRITVIYHIVLCACEVQSATLTDKHRLMVLGNRMLREVFGL
jgi:hypothetical protein